MGTGAGKDRGLLGCWGAAGKGRGLSSNPSPPPPITHHKELSSERRDAALVFTGEAGSGKSRAWDAALAYVCCAAAADAEAQAALHAMAGPRSYGGAPRRPAAAAAYGSPLRSLASESAFLRRRRWQGKGDEGEGDANRVEQSAPSASSSARLPLLPGGHSAERAFLVGVACGAPEAAPFLDAPLAPHPGSPAAAVLSAAAVLRALTRGAVLRNARGSLAGVAVRLWVEAGATTPAPTTAAAAAAVPGPPESPGPHIVGGEVAVVGLDTRGLAASLAVPPPDAADPGGPLLLPPAPPCGRGDGCGIPRAFPLLFRAAAALRAGGGGAGTAGASADVGALVSDPRLLRALPAGARLARLALAEAEAARGAAGLRGGSPEDTLPAPCLVEWLAFEAALQEACGGRDGAAAVVRALAGIAALCDVALVGARGREPPPAEPGGGGEGSQPPASSAVAVAVLSDNSAARFGGLQGHGVCAPPSPASSPSRGLPVGLSPGLRLDDAADLLGLPLPWLVAALTTRPAAAAAAAAAQPAAAASSAVLSASPAAAAVAPAFLGTAQLPLAEAQAAHAALVRALYARVVARVVAAANATLAPPALSPPTATAASLPPLCALSLLDVSAGGGAGCDSGLAALGTACEGLPEGPPPPPQQQQEQVPVAAQGQSRSAVFAKVLPRAPAAAAGGGGGGGVTASAGGLGAPPPPSWHASWGGGLHALLAAYAAERLEAEYEDGVLSAHGELCAAEGVAPQQLMLLPPTQELAASGGGAPLPFDDKGGRGGSTSGGESSQTSLVLAALERPPAGVLPTLCEAAAQGPPRQHPHPHRRASQQQPQQQQTQQMPEEAAHPLASSSSSSSAAAAAALALTKQLLSGPLRRSGCVRGLSPAQLAAAALLLPPDMPLPPPGTAAVAAASPPHPMLALRHTAGDVVYDLSHWLAEQRGPDAPGGEVAAAAAALLRRSSLPWSLAAAAADASLPPPPLASPDDSSSVVLAAGGGLVESTVASLDAALGWADHRAGVSVFWARCLSPHGLGAAAAETPSPCPPAHWDGNRVLAQLQWMRAAEAAALAARGWGWSAPHREAYERFVLLTLGAGEGGGGGRGGAGTGTGTGGLLSQRSEPEPEGAAGSASPRSRPRPRRGLPVFPGPDDAPLPVLVGALLRALWAAYPSELRGACGPMEGEAAVGASRLFLSLRAAEALGALRAARVAEMDAAAAAIQVR